MWDIRNRIVVLMAGIILMFLFSEVHAEAANGPVIQVTREKADVYDNRTKSLVKVGELFNGEVYRAIRPYGENWYEINYADRTAYIPRTTVKEVLDTPIVNENKYYMPLGDLIQLSTNATVYDNSSGTLQPFATVFKNTIFPILSRYGNWYKIDIGGRIGFIHKNSTVMISEKWKTSNVNKVPVLMYHHLLQKKENLTPSNNVVLNVENFQEQMNYLSKNGFETISLSDMEAYIRGDIKLRNKTVLITFDDGHKTNHLYALPVLKQYGFQAGAFIITGRTSDWPSTFNPAGLQSLSKPEMVEMKGTFEFGSHTAAMHDLSGNKSFMLIKPQNEVLNDLRISKNFLNTNYFCYPFGQFDSTTISLVKNAGYRAAYSTKTGYATVNSNLYEIPRFGVYPSTSLKEFAAIVNGTK
ncbi:polysaccharide deacetylase family protein [Bacillus sp. FJAT-29790]|uniref:polysaccharide deacetylase family protein n=1 Tax=Bacillus sp. FJAT-29790 TaxID=1895002 RepID=UPI001C22C751|nr:polysaccharide deacetylase family protein [Bacillus sp. FJAT-29790]MBU8881152.1 polysaccharide deacetylase family protein [Bacillus sp. FJAT-29790]